jgi:hypothetical protein
MRRRDRTSFPDAEAELQQTGHHHFEEVWKATFRKHGGPCFPLYEPRHKFATRLSARGVSDHFVTQILRQGDASMFKRYSQESKC